MNRIMQMIDSRHVTADPRRHQIGGFVVATAATIQHQWFPRTHEQPGAVGSQLLLRATEEPHDEGPEGVRRDVSEQGAPTKAHNPK